MKLWDIYLYKIYNIQHCITLHLFRVFILHILILVYTVSTNNLFTLCTGIVASVFFTIFDLASLKDEGMAVWSTRRRIINVLLVFLFFSAKFFGQLKNKILSGWPWSSTFFIFILYLLLLNIKEHLERPSKRCCFYGIFPSYDQLRLLQT